MDIQLQQLRRAAILGDREAHQRLLTTQQRAGQRRLFGVSLSFCVRSILEGFVKIDEVTEICSSTTGFVFEGEKGPAFNEIVLRYINSYWRGHTKRHIFETCEALLPRITERTKGLPSAWMDADMPIEWGSVPYGCAEGFVGYYIDPKDNSIIYTPADLSRKYEQAFNRADHMPRSLRLKA